MVFSIIGRVAREHPFKFGVVFSGLKTSFSDWIVQTQVEKRERIDWRRNGTFAAFGFFYLGGVQYAIYVPLFSRLFPNAAAYAAAPISAKIADVAGTRNMLAQVALDQFVHHPLMYFPFFYCLKETVNGGTIGGGLEKYSKNWHEDLPALWKIWIPSTIINFSMLPMHMRIPWVASTSLIWTCIISAMRGASDVETSPEEAMNITGSQGKPLIAAYDLGIAAKPAYEYDKTKDHMMVTATGRDRIGFIQEVTTNISNHGGNILDVKAYKVGREFVTIMLIEAPPKSVQSIKKGIFSLKNIQAAVQHTQPWLSDDDAPRCKEGVTYTGHLKATGIDSPGVLQNLTALLSDCSLDITALECKQHLQYKQEGAGKINEHGTEQLFQITGVVRAFTPIDRQVLDAKLAAAEKKFGCRIGVTETDPDPSYSAFANKDAIMKPGRLRLARTMSGTPPPKR